MGDGLAERPPCRPRSQALMGAGLAGTPRSLSTTQSGPYECWVSWKTPRSITQSDPYECGVTWEIPLSTTQ